MYKFGCLRDRTTQTINDNLNLSSGTLTKVVHLALTLMCWGADLTIEVICNTELEKYNSEAADPRNPLSVIIRSHR